MAPLCTAVELFEEMARQGVFTPSAVAETFEMPTALKVVPTITTYGTAAPQSMGGSAYAGLEERSRNDRG